MQRFSQDQTWSPKVFLRPEYKCSIIQTEQNTTDVDKIQIEQNAKEQNTNTTEYKRTKYKWSKYKCNKIQMQQNTNWTKHK